MITSSTSPERAWTVAEPKTPLTAAVLKLVEVVEEENAVLQQHSIVFHASFTDRKNQALRELMAAQQTEVSRATAETARPLLERLSRGLHLNGRLLKLHIAAVGEISDIIIAALKDEQSDGTYSRNRPARVW